MVDFYIPHKSQSHELNDFYRNTARRIVRLAGELEEMRAGLKDLVAMLKAQTAAASYTISALSAAAAQPIRQSDDTIKHPVPAAVFTPVRGAVVAGGAILTEAGDQESRLAVALSDGTRVIPSTVRVEVEPEVSGEAHETDPRGAIEGHVPWWRKMPSDVFGAGATYTFFLSRAFSDPSVNELRFTTFPSAGVSVKSLFLRQGGRWFDFPGVMSRNEGEIVCLFEPMDIEAVKIELASTTLLLINNAAGYHIGLAGIDALRTVPGTTATEAYTAIELAGNGPWTVHKVDIDGWPGDCWDWSLQCGDVYYRSTDIPFTVNENNVGLRITAEPGLRGMFKGVLLRYSS